MDACQYTVLPPFADDLLQNADFTTPPSARTAAPLVALAKELHKNVVVAAISSGVSNRLSRLPEQLNSVAIRLDQIKLHRPRSYGGCWLGCELWRELQLDQFWHSRLKADGRSGVQWQKVLALLVINRLVAPGSEFRLHRQWFNGSAMDVQVDASVASKDRLYRCLDRIMEHRSDLFRHLQQRWKDLFSK